MTRYLVKFAPYKGGLVGEEELKAPNLRDARRIVRAQIGRDAIIFSIREVDSNAERPMDFAHEPIVILANENAELREALTVARGYVESVHLSLVRVMGHQGTVVKPDLDKIDAALAQNGIQSGDVR